MSESSNEKQCAPSVADIVLDTLAEMTGCPRRSLRVEAALTADLGVDSFMLVELVDRMECALGRRLPRGRETHLAGARTVGALIEALSEALVPQRNGDVDA